ncbi:MAG: hypothetical protein JO285_04985 [Kutzneria sp.]|nr:hypothetical protein [Kutzneria sp.]
MTSTPAPNAASAVPRASAGQVDTTTVDAAIGALSDLDTVAVADHPARFEAVHSALADALSAIDRV